MAEKFEGFANAPVDEDGKRLDFRDVDPFVDESDEGKVRDSSQKTASSLIQFHTEDQSTDGAPAAQVPAPVGEDKTGTEPEEAPKADAKSAGGKEGAAS